MDATSSAAYVTMLRACRAGQCFQCDCTQAFTACAGGLEVEVHVARGRASTLVRLVGWPLAWCKRRPPDMQLFTVEGAWVVLAPSCSRLPSYVDDALTFAGQAARGAQPAAPLARRPGSRRAPHAADALLWLPCPDAASMVVAEAAQGSRAGVLLLTKLTSACPFASGFCWTAFPHYERILVGRPPGPRLADAFRASAARDASANMLCSAMFEAWPGEEEA